MQMPYAVQYKLGGGDPHLYWLTIDWPITVESTDTPHWFDNCLEAGAAAVALIAQLIAFQKTRGLEIKILWVDA